MCSGMTCAGQPRKSFCTCIFSSLQLDSNMFGACPADLWSQSWPQVCSCVKFTLTLYWTNTIPHTIIGQDEYEIYCWESCRVQMPVKHRGTLAIYFKLEVKTLVVRCNADFVSLQWCKRSETNVPCKVSGWPKRYGEGFSGPAYSVQLWRGLLTNSGVIFLYICLLILFHYSVSRHSDIF